jgi:hypothetical protein
MNACPHIKITSQPSKTFPGGLATAIVALLLFAATSTPVFAVDAVWLPIPSGTPNSDWNEGGNWDTSVAPEKAGDTATFKTSTVTSLTLSAITTYPSYQLHG